MFVPQRVEVQAAESLKKTLEAEAEQARPAEVVEYEGIFGPHTTCGIPPLSAASRRISSSAGISGSTSSAL